MAHLIDTFEYLKKILEWFPHWIISVLKHHQRVCQFSGPMVFIYLDSQLKKQWN